MTMTMHRLRTAAALLAAVAMLLTLMPAQSAQATLGDQGCTPGYWKNHTSAWPGGWTPDTALQTPFWFLNPNEPTLQNQTWDDNYHSFASSSMHDALQGGGGSGLEGAATILLRAGTAALLNTASTDVSYFTVNQPQIVRMVRDALKTQDRDAIIAAAERLDAANNGRDGCPLGNDKDKNGKS